MSFKGYDTSKYIKNRLMNSKDIFNVVRNLKNEGYDITYDTDNNNYNLCYIKKDNVCVKVCYTDNKDINSKFKQKILYIYY